MKKLFWILFLIPSLLIAQPARFLKGKVYDENKTPVKNLSLRISSIGNVVTTNSGEFVIEIPSSINSVEIVLTNNEYSILYPVDNIIAIPSDPSYITKIVISRTVNHPSEVDELVKKYVRLEDVLKDIGVAQEEFKFLLQDFIRKNSDSVNVDEEKLKSALYKEKRNEKITGISSILFRYLLKAQNLKNGFEIVSSFAFKNVNAQQELVGFVEDYNKSFNEINNNRFSFRNDISTFWNDEPLADDLYETINYALEEMHKPFILDLNDDILEMNKLLSGFYEDEDEEEAVVTKLKTDIKYSVKGMEAKLPVLERRINELLNRLNEQI